jgi:hypothetical protein
MDEVNQFKEQGSVRLTVPLAQGFDKILFDLVQITAVKSGFDGPFSRRIAEQISQKVFRRTHAHSDQRNHQQVEVIVSHSPGQITIRTAISGSTLSEEVAFRTVETS